MSVEGFKKANGLSDLSENLESVIGFTLDDLIMSIDGVDGYLSDMADGYTLDDFPGHQDEDFWDRADIDHALFAGASAKADWQVVFLALKTLLEVCE
tara:strand:+ start:648 stop:938 length:291 start_codon:yes stop_codon:yes gene_type:complete